MKLSDTRSGQAWLGNFSESDVETATRLLNSLRFVSLDTLRNGLLACLERLRAEDKIGTPAVLLPERKLTDIEDDLPLDHQSAIAYLDFHPGARISVTPGSEGIIGTVLREFAIAGSDLDNASPWISPDAPLELLRNRRCRSIILVTDYCGTGNQVLTLAKTLARNKTIKSWRSLKLIRIHVVAFAAAPAAIRLLRNHPNVDEVHLIEAAPSFDTAPWPGKLRREIVQLCQRESRSKAFALGFHESAGLLATARRAPNNLPSVFIQTKNWSPLFPGRQVTHEVAEDLSGYISAEPVDVLADRVGQTRIGKNERLTYLRPTSRELLGALLLLHRGRLALDELAAKLGKPIARASELSDALLGLGFVDKDRRITSEGRKEILAQKSARRTTSSGIEGSDATYYPHSLKL